MADYIRLLPDSVANQIAAGEVIQRPASVVKELLENSIDAGASKIRLIIKDAGRTLIQVIDNGIGMSVADARMCFERHATSKIREAKELFSIRTLGFRGEALASIAAVAQVELRTCKEGAELGTAIIIEGSKFRSQESVAMSKGTSFQVKNLFFNIPARRNFLKSDAVEFRHILEEFQRVSLVHPDIEFSLHHNDKLVFQLSKVGLKQRIAHVFGNSINEKLLPVELHSENVTINGFIGKPETARKTRGEQYFFANGRFIRHAYLHHAVEQAFEELIPEAAIPTYFLFIEVDPASIDVNIHPTKTEVNFQYGQVMYASMRAAVKQALGMFSLSPVIDFETETSFNFDLPKGYDPKPPTITINPDYNPFARNAGIPPSAPSGIKPNRENWEKVFEILNPNDQADKNSLDPNEEPGGNPDFFNSADDNKSALQGIRLIQVQQRFILANVKSGLMIIDQHKAHQRIIFEKMIKMLEDQSILLQRSLFPQTIHFSVMDTEILKELTADFLALGIEVDELGGDSFVVNSKPPDLSDTEVISFIEAVLEDHKKNRKEIGNERQIKIARILSDKMAVKNGRILQSQEMQSIVDELFSCQVPDLAPDGSKVIRILTTGEIEKLLS